MKKLLLPLVLIASVNSFAGLPEMIKIYNQPNLAPKVRLCKGNKDCNAFVALSKQWKFIPNNYRYDGFNIKAQSKDGITWDKQGRNIGLAKGFNLNTEKSNRFADMGLELTGDRYYEHGYAVLLFIEDKNNWK